MNTRYKDGKIEFDLHDLLQDVSIDTKLEMLESPVRGSILVALQLAK